MLTDEELARIPDEMKSWPHWVTWRYEVKANGQETKVPYNPHKPERADTTDPHTWGPYLTAVAAMRATRADGIGFVFSEDDPYVGVDLDDCLSYMQLTPPEDGYVEALNSYTEVSPSCTGVKVIFRGKLPDDLKRHSWGGDGIYDQGRFFTITGNPLSRTLQDIRPVPVDVLNGLLGTWFPPQTQVEVAESEERYTDDEVRARASCAANSAKFLDLDAGRWQSWYTSRSEADAGLIAMLAFYTGPCPGQLDRLFRQSGMMRDKWDEGRGNGETYGERTIRKVLEVQEEYYAMGTRTTDTPVQGIVGPNPGEGTLYPRIEFTVPEIVEKVKAPSLPLARKRWRALLDGYAELGTHDRPLYLEMVHGHIAPLAKRLGADWCDWMALAFLSTFFPRMRFENQKPIIWTLGVSVQSAGKSVTGDELNELATGLADKLATNLASFTSGSNAGLLRRLAGTDKQVLAYLSEWTGFTKAMETEHSASMREALLNYYDGRGYSHTLAQEVIDVKRPHLVIAGMTTKAAWAANTDFLDTGNGFYSRFAFVAPDVAAGETGYTFRTTRERDAIIEALYDHLESLPQVEMAFFEGRNGHSPAYEQYMGYLGLGTVAEAVDLDEVGYDMDEGHSLPGGRLAARVKRVSLVLELLEEAPQIRAGQLRIREANVERAVRLVQRGAAYAQRCYSWLARSKDDEQAAMVRRKLATGAKNVYDLVLATTLSAVEVNRALELLATANLVESRIDGGQRLYQLRGV